LNGLLALAWWGWALIVAGGAAVAAAAGAVGRKIWKPGPTPIGAAGHVDVRAANGSGVIALPPGAPTPTVAPDPFPGVVVAGAATSVTVTTMNASGQPLGDVAVDLTVGAGNDGVHTSLIDFGTVTGVGTTVGSVVKTATDANGQLKFLLFSTGQGDQDTLTIHVDPLRRPPLPDFTYRTA
jgi:hypothetical protein